MNIVITGSTGYIANNFLKIFNHSNIIKTSLLITNDNYYEKNQQLMVIKKKNIIIDKLILFGWGNLNNYNSLEHTNIILQNNLKFIEYMINHFNIKEIIGIGTCLEYGNIEGSILENQYCNPTTEYGKGKLLMLNYLGGICGKRDIKFKWARLFYNYGKYQNKDTLFTQLNKSIKDNKSFFQMSMGNQKRDYLPVERVVFGIKNLILCENIEGVVNICSGKSISVYDLVKKYLKSNNYVIKIIRGKVKIPEYEAFDFWGSDNLYLNQINSEKLLIDYF